MFNFFKKNQCNFFYLQTGLKHLDYDNAIFARTHFKYTLFVRVSDEVSPVL